MERITDSLYWTDYNERQYVDARNNDDNDDERHCEAALEGASYHSNTCLSSKTYWPHYRGVYDAAGVYNSIYRGIYHTGHSYSVYNTVYIILLILSVRSDCIALIKVVKTIWRQMCSRPRWIVFYSIATVLVSVLSWDRLCCPLPPNECTFSDLLVLSCWLSAVHSGGRPAARNLSLWGGSSKNACILCILPHITRQRKLSDTVKLLFC